MSNDFQLDEYWEEVLEELSGKVSAVSFDVWIRTLKPQFAKGSTLVLSSIILSEVITLASMIGALCIIGGVYLAEK